MRIELLPTALACLAVSVSAQTGTPPGGPAVNPPGKIWIGDGVTSVGTYNGTTDAPFAAALLAYGGDLREIEVLPGTYTFGATVNVAQAGVRLYGSKGAVIRTRASLQGVLFAVSGDGFTLDGLTLRETRAGGGGLLRIQADEASIVGCTVDLQTAPPIGSAAGVELAPLAGQPPLEGALVRNNRFVFHTPLSSMTGQVGLRAASCRSIRVFANAFTPPDLSPPAQMHQAIELEGCAFSTVAGNVLGDVSAHAELVRLHSDTAAAAAVSGTYAEHVGGTAVLHVGGASGRYAVTGNAIGRAIATVAQVRVEESAGAVVVGNQIHRLNVGAKACLLPPATQRAVLTTGASDAIVSDNAFGLALTPQIGFSSTTGVTCVGNRFETDQDDVKAAIDLDPSAPVTSHTLVVGNLSYGKWCDILMGLSPDVGNTTDDNKNIQQP